MPSCSHVILENKHTHLMEGLLVWTPSPFPSSRLWKFQCSTLYHTSFLKLWLILPQFLMTFHGVGFPNFSNNCLFYKGILWKEGNHSCPHSIKFLWRQQLKSWKVFDASNSSHLLLFTQTTLCVLALGTVLSHVKAWFSSDQQQGYGRSPSLVYWPCTECSLSTKVHSTQSSHRRFAKGTPRI